jgi:hypothetical protein
MTVLGAKDVAAVVDMAMALYLRQVAPRAAQDVSLEEFRGWLAGVSTTRYDALIETPLIDIGAVERLRCARERSTLTDLFMVASHLPRMRRELGGVVMLPRSMLVHIERLLETTATVHRQEERLNDVYGAMGRDPEVDFSGCSAVSVGGYHSVGYGDVGGRCNWCGKLSPVEDLG